MKIKLAIGLVLALCAGTFAFAGDGSWTGYISDSHCGAKGVGEKHVDCATKCVKEKGASLVFVDDADHKVYNITDQDKVAAHAGHHVTVKGSLDGDKLTVASLEMVK